MGIFKAAAGSATGVMADQWLEVFTCESMGNDVIAMRGVRKTSERSANTKGEENVITDGSTLIVNSGQCAISVDRGEVTGVYAQPGANTYHSDRSKSVFSRGGFKGVFSQMRERIGYGGVAPVYQIIMYIDLKEHHSCPFRVTRAMRLKDRANLADMDIAVTLGGLFSFRVCDPAAFYRNICGNASGTVRVEDVLPQMQTELENALAVGMASLCEEGALSPSEISLRINEVADALAVRMTEKWTALRGFALVSLAISEVNIAPADLRLIQGLERDKVFTDPTMAAAHLVGAQGDAMRTAAGNTAGSAGTFVASNVVRSVSPNSSIAELYGMKSSSDNTNT